jgi:hypothetical protein
MLNEGHRIIKIKQMSVGAAVAFRIFRGCAPTPTGVFRIIKHDMFVGGIMDGLNLGAHLQCRYLFLRNSTVMEVNVMEVDASS